MSAAPLIFEPDGAEDGAELLGRSSEVLGAVVARVEPGDLRLPTPCAGWTVHDLLNHVVGGAEMFAGALRGEPVRDISGRLPDAVGDDPMAALGRAGAAVGAAASSPGAMDRILPLPFATMAGRTFLRFAAVDLLVHSWDLSTALGTEVEAPDDLVEPLDHFAHQVLGSGSRPAASFGPAVAAPPGAPAMARLVAYTGRTP